MSALAEFLLARIAERSASADLTLAQGDTGNIYDVATWRLASLECESLRMIVEGFVIGEMDRTFDDRVALVGPFGEEFAALEASIVAERTWVLQILALAHMHHPDYREEWRP